MVDLPLLNALVEGLPMSNLGRRAVAGAFSNESATLKWIVVHLRPRLERQCIVMRDAMCVEEHVAIAIWWLANTTSYSLMGNTFGIARSTIAGIVMEVCLAMEQELLRWVVCLRLHERVFVLGGISVGPFAQPPTVVPPTQHQQSRW